MRTNWRALHLGDSTSPNRPCWPRRPVRIHRRRWRRGDGLTPYLRRRSLLWTVRICNAGTL
jgi:hypothetical protein